jgi:hypothetical protein
MATGERGGVWCDALRDSRPTFSRNYVLYEYGGVPKSSGLNGGLNGALTQYTPCRL